MLSCSKVTFIYVNMSSADATLKQYKKKSHQMAVKMTHGEDEEMYKNRSSQLGLLEDTLDFRFYYPKYNCTKQNNHSSAIY